MNAKIKEKIRTALTGQTSGLIASEIRERGGIKEAAACMAALMQMKDAGEVLPHQGETPRSTRYSFNPDFIVDTPAAPLRRRKVSKKTKKAGAKKRAAKASKTGGKRKAKAVRVARPAEPDCITAITVDHGLVILVEGEASRVYSPEHTIAIATLLGAHFG